MPPTLSVCIANYNHGRFLERCLGAVMAQERRPDEVIVYDDASTDNSLIILEELQKRWPELRVERGVVNRGVVEAYNTVANMASGDWLHLAGADDVVLPGFYRLALREIEEYPKAGATFGGFIGVEEDTGERWMENASQWLDPGYFSSRDMIWKLFNKAPALFGTGFTYIFKRRFFLEEGGFISELKMYDELIFRVIAAKYGAIYLGPAPLCCVRSSFSTFSGQARKNRSIYAEVLLNHAGPLMRTRYGNLFPRRFIDHWEKKWLKI